MSADTARTIAVVTGAARGVGRGIARVLGRAGATVFVTDLESRAHRVSPLPGTVEDTAEQVTALGGTGVAVPLDHRDDDAVAGLFGRIRDEHGGLDLLVANACNGNAEPFHGGPFWTLPEASWANMVDVGVRTHVATVRSAAPLLIERGGLCVLTGYLPADDDVLGGHLYYDLAVTAISRLARTMARDLAPHGVTALCLAPGFTATEAIVAALGEDPAGADPIEHPGRAVRALLADPEVARFAGRTVPVAELAAAPGF